MVTRPDLDPRPLPAAETARSVCQGCGRRIVWAVTVAGPNGRGGKLMPLDPVEDLTGNVAVTAPAPGRGRLHARVLTRGETFDRPLDYAAMPHFATCVTRTQPEIPTALLHPPEDPRRRRGRTRR